MAVEKVRPDANIEFDGIAGDGRNPYCFVNYRCPKCRKTINLGCIECEKCGTFFDWTKKAVIKVHRSIHWE